MQTLTVHTAKPYTVRIGKGLLPQCGQRLAEVCTGRTAMLVSDDRVFPLYGQAVQESLQSAGFRVVPFVFPHGEAQKNLATYGRLLECMCESGLTRADAAVALGGGVVGDLTGFASATYQRGIAFVQLPTSLLAAVDASVGGKTAINLDSGKNQAGCFYQPSLVLCDTDTLLTLPEAEYRGGCAEIIKYGMIADAPLLEALRRKAVSAQYEDVIHRCISIKRDFVEADEHDTGLRMQLNFGHTIGHAIESCSSYRIPHGEAVAMGMAAITRAAITFSICEPALAETLQQLLQQYELPTELPFPAEALYQAAQKDKKNESSIMRLIVAEKVGQCRILPIEREAFRDWLKAGGAR